VAFRTIVSMRRRLGLNGPTYLDQTITGIKALGYTFVGGGTIWPAREAGKHTGQAAHINA
jgi:hypothetical protein